MNQVQSLSAGVENEKKKEPARVLRMPVTRRTIPRGSGASGVSVEWLRAHAIESAKRDD